LNDRSFTWIAEASHVQLANDKIASPKHSCKNRDQNTRMIKGTAHHCHGEDDMRVVEYLKCLSSYVRGSCQDPIEEFAASSNNGSARSSRESSSSNVSDGGDDEPLDDSGIDAIRNAPKL
jgi:hypothetical protein